MSTRRFYLMAVIAAFGAIVLHATALGLLGRSVHYRADAVTLTGAERVSTQANAVRISTLGHAAIYVGFALAAGSVVLSIVSARKHEPARRSTVLALLFCYFLLQLFIV